VESLDVNTADADALLAAALPRHAGDWADIGAGDGTFTRALARRLQPGSRVYAVDRDRSAIASLRRLKAPDAEIIPVAGDFTRPLKLPGIGVSQLSGLLFANALHFVPNPRAVLTQLLSWLRPGGRIVIVEYEGRQPSRWVPYPISAERLPDLVDGLGLPVPTITATRPSAYGGSLYVAVTQRDS
jgi:trans-aconitate methyltransferase